MKNNHVPKWARYCSWTHCASLLLQYQWNPWPYYTLTIWQFDNLTIWQFDEAYLRLFPLRGELVAGNQIDSINPNLRQICFKYVEQTWIETSNICRCSYFPKRIIYFPNIFKIYRTGEKEKRTNNLKYICFIKIFAVEGFKCRQSSER